MKRILDGFCFLPIVVQSIALYRVRFIVLAASTLLSKEDFMLL